MRGTITLVESGDETVETVVGDIKVSIPLVGGKLEGLIGDLPVRAAQRGQGRRHLARRAARLTTPTPCTERSAARLG